MQRHLAAGELINRTSGGAGMQNLEQKFWCADLDAAAARAREMGARFEATLEQADYFFRTSEARLKLRVERVRRPGAEPRGRAELISYQRAEAAVARPSDYHLFYLTDGMASDDLAAVLAQALGPATVLRKRRELWLWRNTRIHIDRVEHVGSFVELETVMATQTVNDAREELAQAVQSLALQDVVQCAYVDLLTGNGRGQ